MYLMVLKATAEAAIIADNPTAARTTWLSAPSQMPYMAINPVFLPPLAVCASMNAKSGPGARVSRMAALKNVIQCATV